MNKLIKQLYDLALEQHVSNGMAWEELNPEKFARLIIEECVSACADPIYTTLESPSDLINHHFGVYND